MPHQPRKRYGQHFLVDELVVEDIIAVIGPRRGDHIIEIGPGTGALTKPLLESGIELDVIEIDRDLIARLKTTFSGFTKLHIHPGDALKFDLDSLIRPGQALRVVGNLPYNISTPLLLKLLMRRNAISDMVFMLQKEVVDRLVAEPGTRDYGRLTVIAQYLSEIESHFEVGPESFEPPPRVVSGVVSLRPRPDQPMRPALDWFTEVVRHAFAQRRKTLRNTLGRFLGLDVLQRCGIDGAMRPEQLSVQDFARLAAATQRRDTPDCGLSKR